MTLQPENITILGAGSWAIAIAGLLADKNHNIAMWEFEQTAAKKLQQTREDRQKLPGVKLSNEIVVTNSLKEAVTGSEVLLFVVPAQETRSVCEKLRGKIGNIRLLVNFSKGIEVQSLKRVSEVIREVLDDQIGGDIVTVSGPSHAEEVARSMPTSVVAGGVSETAVSYVQNILSTQTFRVYSSSDIVGVELGGALKNIIAIAAGILDGLELGDNTMGALLTRGLAEITRLGIKMGAKPATFAGLSGLGDLITTCNSKHSRNRYVGERMGRGEKLTDILDSMAMIAEGVETTRAAAKLAKLHNVEMPITNEVYQVLFENKPAMDTVNDLMTRELKKEVYS